MLACRLIEIEYEDMFGISVYQAVLEGGHVNCCTYRCRNEGPAINSSIAAQWHEPRLAVLIEAESFYWRGEV